MLKRKKILLWIVICLLILANVFPVCATEPIETAGSLENTGAVGTNEVTGNADAAGNAENVGTTDTTGTADSADTAVPTGVAPSDNWPLGPGITSEGAILMDSATGAVLYDKNSHQRLYPASITKVMTVLLVLENSSLDEVVTFSHDAVFNIEAGSNHIGMTEGEQLTMEQCLYGILLESANEVSYAVAEHVGGTYDNFINMMNEKARELGCQDTNFVNPHGLHDDNHYSCAYDMALITQAALKNDIFRKITGTWTYTIPPTNLQPEARPLANSHKMFPGNDEPYEGFEGGKTGFTDQALNTLITFAKRGDLELICVTMGGNGTHYTDTAAILDFGFDNFHTTGLGSVLPMISGFVPYYFKNSGVPFSVASSLRLQQTGKYIVLPGGVAPKDISFDYKMDEQNPALAHINFRYGDRSLGSVSLGLESDNMSLLPFQELREIMEGEPDAPKPALSKIKILFYILIVVVIALLIFYFRHYHASNRRYYRRR